MLMWSEFYKAAGQNATVFNQRTIKCALTFIWKLVYKQDCLLVLSLWLLLESYIVQHGDMLPFNQNFSFAIIRCGATGEWLCSFVPQTRYRCLSLTLDGWIQMGEAGTRRNGILLINISQHYRLQHISSDPIWQNCLQVIGTSIIVILLAIWET